MTFLPSPILGSFTFLIFCLNTVFWCGLLYPFGLLKWLIPAPGFRKLMNRISCTIAECWVAGNRLGLDLTQRISWEFEGLEGLERNRSYLVACKHQSGVDIVALQLAFNRRIPVLRFFIKKELFWVPVLGLAWWALDFPFMRRHSKDFLAKHPEMKGKDLKTTKKACERFRGSPVTILNFVEGTRFTPAKQARQNSPYKHLLLPKAGGTAAVLSALGEHLDSFLDVTIAYPGGSVPTFWQLISGRASRVRLKVREFPIPEQFRNRDYDEDAAFREEFQKWLRLLWERKDAELTALLT
jgi:1-acyl-sn-glycerol-3-phosphate acyltransferase